MEGKGESGEVSRQRGINDITAGQLYNGKLCNRVGRPPTAPGYRLPPTNESSPFWRWCKYFSIFSLRDGWMEIEFLEEGKKGTFSKKVKQKRRMRGEMWSKGGLLSQGDSEREQALTRRGLRNRKFGLGDFSGNRGERNWKTRRQAEVWRVRDNKRLPSFCLSVLFSIFLRREAREEGIEDTRSGDGVGWKGGMKLEFNDSNSRFNRVFNWATMNQWSLFSRGFALRSKRGEREGISILGHQPPPLRIDPCGRLRGYTSLISAQYQAISYPSPMEFINLDLSADNCEPTLFFSSSTFILFYSCLFF